MRLTEGRHRWDESEANSSTAVVQRRVKRGLNSLSKELNAAQLDA